MELQTILLHGSREIGTDISRADLHRAGEDRALGEAQTDAPGAGSRPNLGVVGDFIPLCGDTARGGVKVSVTEQPGQIDAAR